MFTGNVSTLIYNSLSQILMLRCSGHFLWTFITIKQSLLMVLVAPQLSSVQTLMGRFSLNFLVRMHFFLFVGTQ